ncbi:very short patch repair endonuclease [Isoptericola sp. b515]|uniref:very short patch repair endonuclease n=1 Tax=Isoptericola sp. b515 TaxID=3064652 RepID=UPI00271288CB|nr:very short patch repair endonuclease [Isoptericola sp. b515]MDO8147491.1 very short patch repair endonuclease [Isoptericola sp. b515]
MSAARRRDTKPEVDVRRLLHAQGLRYRVAYRVPGKPRRTIDIAFTRAKVAVFLDGCFWHGCPEHGTLPQANGAWWAEKLRANHDRDLDTTAHLEGEGWLVLRFWEHESPTAVADTIAAAVRSRREPPRSSPRPG